MPTIPFFPFHRKTQVTQASKTSEEKKKNVALHGSGPSVGAISKQLKVPQASAQTTVFKYLKKTAKNKTKHTDTALFRKVASPRVK